MQRHACDNCHTIRDRYCSGKRVRCTICRRLVGIVCCRTITNWMIWDNADGSKRLVGCSSGPITCVACVPNAPKPAGVEV